MREDPARPGDLIIRVRRYAIVGPLPDVLKFSEGNAKIGLELQTLV